MKRIFAFILRCCDNKFEKKVGFFELLGCDIMLDS